jgi:histidyl-tRNA synthetase
VSDNTKFGPPKGMRDWLPQETLLRQKLIRLIEHHYQLYGFQPIDTPVMENIEVLQGKGGGENEKLMFKITKRGEELDRVLNNPNFKKRLEAREKVENDLQSGVYSEAHKNLAEKAIDNFDREFPGVDINDMGLRFDLTVPLARYYSNHVNDLPKPFRCYHIGPVWRADRPQKGRYREFYQCDIDIVGGALDNYEVELLLATDRILNQLNVGKYKIRISDKRLLPMLLEAARVQPSDMQKVAIAIDKLDKKSKEDVLSEVRHSGVDDYSFSFIKMLLTDVAVNGDIEDLRKWFKDFNPQKYEEFNEIVLGIEKIHRMATEVNENVNLKFDHLLVRGFDYYTGPVFEINVEDKDFTSSIGGGGRYDGLIEKLGGPKNTPAVGISLGFERILLILMEKAKAAVQTHSPRVFIVNNGQPEKDILVLAEELRSEGIQVETSLENKKIGQQLEAAQKNRIEYAITEFQPGHKSYKVRKLSTREDREMPLAELYDLMKRLSEGVED